MRNEKFTKGAVVPKQTERNTPRNPSHEVKLPLDRINTAVWIYDIDNACILFANDPALTLWQADSEEDLRRRNLGKDMSQSVAQRLEQYQRDFADRDATFSEMWTLFPNGVPTSVTLVFSAFELPDGRMAMQVQAVGISEEEPENLRSAEALLHTDVMIALHDNDGLPLYMNPAARNAATSATQAVAEKFVDPAEYQRLQDKLDTLGEHRTVSKVNTSSGPRWHDLTLKRCSDAVTGRPAILVTAIDVSELKNARDKARYLADRDQLTGCYNRSYLQHYMASLGHYQPGTCGLLYFDVDRFKQINDRLGHEMGDVVLKEITQRVNKVIRQTDTFVRLGGDEFIVVFEDIPSEEELASKLEKLLKDISAPITHDKTRVTATVSMGLTSFSPAMADFTKIMREADLALYASKQTGRNRMTVFNAEMGALAKAREVIEFELRQGIDRQEFVLHYQPRLCLKTGRVVSAEALVRWQHPKRGLIMPGKFIPICEETGMIEDLGQLVLEKSCQKAIEMHQMGRDLEVSVNISPRQFDDDRLLKSLERFSAHPDFPFDKIELEITENILIGDHLSIAKKLRHITDLGYRIAIDDFGTGYSNLSYISRFPLHCLKIDQSFIAQLPSSGPIIKFILTLAEQLGATIVAEGVETEAQFNWLLEQDCCQVQGYLFSRPVPEDELDAIIEGLNTSELVKHP